MINLISFLSSYLWTKSLRRVNLWMPSIKQKIVLRDFSNEIKHTDSGKIIHGYLMSEKSIDQNIFPSVLGTAGCFLLPEVNGRGQRTHRAVPSTEGKMFWSIDFSDIKSPCIILPASVCFISLE